MDLCFVGRALCPGEPVLEDERRDAHGIQPLGDQRTFQIHNKVAVTSSRTDHDRRAGGLLLRRQEHEHGGLMNVGDAMKTIRAWVPLLRCTWAAGQFGSAPKRY